MKEKKKDYKPVLIPIIRQVLPKILAEDIFSGRAHVREEVERIEKERADARAKSKTFCDEIIGVKPLPAPVAQFMSLQYRYGDDRSTLLAAIEEIEKERASERARRKRRF